MTYALALDPAAHPELSLLMATLQDSTREWRENLGRVSPEAIVWQPYPNGPSIGGQLLHMMDCESWWLRVVAEGEKDDLAGPAAEYARELNVDHHHWPAPPKKPLKWYLALHDAHRAENLELIRRHGDPSSLHGKRQPVTYAWIVAHLVEHDSYHGGQAVLLNEMYKHLRRQA